MSKVRILGALSSVTTSAVFNSDTTPFVQKNSATLMAYSPDGAFSGSAKLQSSDDASTWTDVSGTTVTTAGTTLVTVNSMAKHYRMNCTSRSAGTIAMAFLD